MLRREGHRRGRRPVFRTGAIAAIIALLSPAGLPLVAELAHGVFHSFEEAVRAQLDLSLIEGLDRVLEEFVHTHGPDEAPHAHLPIIDLALVAAGEAKEDAPRGALATELRLDRHTIPSGPSLPIASTARFQPASPEEAHRSVPSRSPEPPPPRL